MKVGTLFVQRPVMTSMIFVGVAIFGLLAWFRLPQELFPNISVPQLVVITKYSNAAPEEIENLITKPIEEAVGTVPNLKRISSISKEGMSAVTLDFGWGTDMGFAHLATREKLDRMKDRLPQEAEEPIIKRVNPFSHPVVILSVTSEMNLADLTDLCTDVIKKKLEKADGVASVTLSGGQKREILVEVDRGRLSASSISLPMVVEALKNANYDYPAGTTQGKVVEYLVRTHGRFQSIHDIGQTIVQVENPNVDPIYKWKQRDDHEGRSSALEQRLIPLAHLATIEPSLQDRTSYSRYNGLENISISIQKQADANTVAVAKAIKQAIAELKPSLPSSVKTQIIYNEADYITDALQNMRGDIIVGGFLAFCVLFFFLGNIRDSMFAGLAIPMAMLTTLIMMFISDFSINMLTLAGLALSIGSMSDCSICISENITRHVKELNKPLSESAIDGSNEMVASMLSSTLTNVAVFLPLLFVQGVAQQLFRGLFIVTIFTNFASLFVSLTLIPRMAAYSWELPHFVKRPAWLDKFMLTDEKFKNTTQFYEQILGKALANGRAVFATVFMLFGLSFLIVFLMPFIFMPKMDQGQFLVQLTMPIGTRLDVTNMVASKMESALANIKGVDVMANVGSAQEEEELDALKTNEAQIVVTLGPKAKLSTMRVIEKFKNQIKKENLEGGRLTYILQDSPLQSALAGGAPIEVELKGPDLGTLKYLSTELTSKFSEMPFLYGVTTTFALPSKESQVLVDKDIAASFSLSVADIARTALIAIKGVVATKFKEGGKETDIRVRLRTEDRQSSESIRQLALRSPRGMMVPLEAVAQVNPGLGASEIRHLDQQRSVVVSANVDGVSTDKALKEVRKVLANYRNIKDTTIELGGESKRQSESFASLKYTFILAILLVYMIMAAEFESLVQPLIIMVTVPFSFIGVAFTLFLTNVPFSSVAVLGVVILAGIVVNNGIVLIDHINSLLDEGMDLKDAIINGSVTRLRPILMTSFTAILGALPLTLGIGRGDELAQPLALVTFGGMFVSTMLTLLVIPLLYYQMEMWQRKRHPRESGDPGIKHVS